MKFALLITAIVLGLTALVGSAVHAQTNTSTPTPTQAATTITPTTVPAGAPNTGYGTMAH